MDSFPIFFTVRSITFTCITMICLLWLVLLSVEIFTRWDVSDATSRSLVVLLFFSNTFTVFVPPVLLLFEFRIWLDAARVFFLLVLQTCTAVAFTCWRYKIRCSSESANEITGCKVADIFTLVACWIIPAILISYATYFATMVFLQSRIPVKMDSPIPYSKWTLTSTHVDPEMAERELVALSGVFSGAMLRSPTCLSQLSPTMSSAMPRQPQVSLPSQSSQPSSLSLQCHKSLPLHPTDILFPPNTYAPMMHQPHPKLLNSQLGVVDPLSPAGPLSMAPPSMRADSSESGDSKKRSSARQSTLSKPTPAYLM